MWEFLDDDELLTSSISYRWANDITTTQDYQLNEILFVFILIVSDHVPY